MNKLPKIAILGNKSKNNISKYVWLEVCHKPNVTYIPEINKKGLFRFFYRMLFNCHVLRRIPVVKYVKEVVDHSFCANFLVYDIPPKMDVVVCTNTSLNKLYSYGKLEKYRRKYHAKIVIFLHDTFDRLSKPEIDSINAKRKEGLIDRIYSFDPSDCSKYGFSYLTQCYTPVKLPLINETRYDIYFGGRNKGRLPIITSFLQLASINHVQCFFRMPELSQTDRNVLLEHSPSFFEEQMLSYEETLQEMLYTNCILEIVQEGQHGMSWRAVEAFVYNKKLLTNNEDIKNNHFYNPEYIHVFSKVDDIDFNWVKEIIPVDYHYHNEYSPIEFIRKMQRDLKL